MFDDDSAYQRYKELFFKGKAVNLKDLAEELQMQFDDSRHYLNIATGEIVWIEDNYLAMPSPSFIA